MSASNAKMRRLAVAVSLAFLAGGSAWAGDVTVYDKAPSVEELQRKLTGGEGTEGKRKLKTRAIVFGDAAPAPAAPAQEPAPQAAPQPATSYAAPAPAAAPAVPSQAAAPAAPAQQTMQVGENAIAFPINFRVNSSDVMPESIPFLESIAGLLQKDPGIRLLIEGHTDISGNAARNTVLSRERAFSVMNYLIDHYRIDPMRLVPVGKGFSEPLGGMEPTNPKNRRVQFRIIG
ncbi:MAG: OmpA family protein [Sterolibacteriaceae bacterium MAG5]|nr:OmpA family protein [Candidatus Nitricoxidireducens bremensis]